MSFFPAPLTARPGALLDRVAPVTRLVAGSAWLVGAVATTDVGVGLRLCLAALVALPLAAGIPWRSVPRRMAPIVIGAAGLALVAAFGSELNRDPATPALLDLGAVRLTAPGLAAGLGLGLRLVAIALTSLLVFGGLDTTRLADSLVQQWRMPDRFAFGTIAALRLAPLIAADWTAVGAARRLRGLEPRWLPGRVVAAIGRLFTHLVAAIRRAERAALAMDARGFDSGTARSRYRLVSVGPLDGVVIAGAVGSAVALVLVGR